MGKIIAKIRKRIGKSFCFSIFLVGFVGTLTTMGAISSGLVDDNITIGFLVLCLCCFTITGVLFLAAGLHDTSRDETVVKPPRFFTADKDGNIVLTEVSTPPPLDCNEIRRADGKVDISLEIHSKEQAVEVLAALAVMYDKGGIAAADYNCNVQKIREHFNL